MSKEEELKEKKPDKTDKKDVEEDIDVEKAMKEISEKGSSRNKLEDTLTPLINAATKIGEASKKLPENVRQPFSDLTSLLLLQQISQTPKKTDDESDPYNLKGVEGAFYRRKHMRELMKMDSEGDGGSPLNKQIIDSMANLSNTIKELKEDKIKSGEEKAFNDLKGIISDFAQKIEGKISGTPGTSNPIEMLNKTQEYITTAENLLKATGRNVTSQGAVDVNAIKEDIIKNPIALAEALEKHGYKIVGKPIPYGEHEDAVKGAYERGKAEAADNFAIERTGKTIEAVVSTLAEKIIGPFLMRYGTPFEQPQEAQVVDVQTQETPSPQTPPPTGDSTSRKESAT